MTPNSIDVLERLHETVAAIFDQAQLTLANHRKNCVALYKLHQQAGAVTRPVKNGTVLKLVGERAFGDVFIVMINRVLVVKKGPAAADRVVRFVGSYVKFMNEKGVYPTSNSTGAGASHDFEFITSYCRKGKSFGRSFNLCFRTARRGS